ncbi:DUF962 domain-containing protein [archaeon]|nr:MAG: DUF962 domain-containing protein [archaeon]
MGIVLALFALSTQFPPTVQPAANKPFNTFEEFYPFYISQHADNTCRRMHFVGTTLVFLLTLLDPFMLPSLVLGGMVGYVGFLHTRGMDHGLVEMLAMFATFQFFVKRLSGKWQLGLATLVIGYTFAWIGHFFFEHNRPATFIYPLFSLMGDFKMWFEILSTQRAW